MSRWFRHYAGMMRDEKLVAVAIRAKQPVHLVTWVWGAILESAAERDDNGLFEIDAAEVAYFLRTDEADICAVLDALADAGRVDSSRVVKWGDRQYQSDKSAERQARYRERSRGKVRVGDDQQTNGDVTPPSPDRHVTPQDTETEAETEKIEPPALSLEPAGARDLFGEAWEAFPRNPASVEALAEAAFRKLKPKDQERCVDAAKRYRLWFEADNRERERTDAAGARFAPFMAKWIETGAWKQAETMLIPGQPTAAQSAVLDSHEYVDRHADAALFRACERIRNKAAPSSINNFAFAKDIVAQARKELAH